MESPDNKELIEGISALFKAHEEPYELGSWENFKQKRRKKPVLMIWLGVAAALIIIVSVVVPEFMRKETATPIIAKQQPVHDKITPEKSITPLADKLVIIPEKRQQKIMLPREEQRPADTLVKEEVIVVHKIAPSSDIPSPAETPTEGIKKAIPKENSVMKFLQKESQNAQVRETQEPSRWNFGVELLPTVLQSKVSMGAGVTTEFKLSKHFSVSSGIAYVALDASKSIDHQAVSLMSSKKLIAIDANIRGIDIPLSLTYNLNKKLYTSMGVSYFNIIEEKRNNKYETEMQVAISAKSASTGMFQVLDSKLIEQNNEVSSELPLKGNSYLGFFNFSVGHKQEVFNQYNIVIEPFIKIPVGRLSNEDLRLGNGGVKLRFTF
jgi:hypothetical protein